MTEQKFRNLQIQQITKIASKLQTENDESLEDILNLVDNSLNKEELISILNSSGFDEEISSKAIDIYNEDSKYVNNQKKELTLTDKIKNKTLKCATHTAGLLTSPIFYGVALYSKKAKKKEDAFLAGLMTWGVLTLSMLSANKSNNYKAMNFDDVKIEQIHKKNWKTYLGAFASPTLFAYTAIKDKATLLTYDGVSYAVANPMIDTIAFDSELNKYVSKIDENTKICMGVNMVSSNNEHIIMNCQSLEEKGLTNTIYGPENRRSLNDEPFIEMYLETKQGFQEAVNKINVFINK